MLDIQFIRENKDMVRQASENKGVEIDIDLLLEVDERRREQRAQLDELNRHRNELSKSASGSKPSSDNIEKGRDIKSQIASKENELKETEDVYIKMMYSIPNIPTQDTPVGEGESANEIVKTQGEITSFDFKPKDHLDLGLALDVIDVERATKISGNRFAYIKNDLVLLEFALVHHSLRVLRENGFSPVIPPVLINKSITNGLGYWNKEDNDDFYWVNENKQENSDGFYLVGTAEHSLVPMHKDEKILAKDLPIRYAGFSTSFRKEAGTYGKDTRGILRVHQFDKVEMVSFTTPDKDKEELEFLLSMEEKLFQSLGIPYQVVKIGTGDVGFPQAAKYDIEAWMPGQEKYREVTSASTTTDFQARRLNIKYSQGDDLGFVHILNGTAFAIGRTIIAIMENYQTKDGTIIIPEVLRPYMMGIDEIKNAK